MVGGAADSDTGGDVAHHQGLWGRGRVYKAGGIALSYSSTIQGSLYL